MKSYRNQRRGARRTRGFTLRRVLLTVLTLVFGLSSACNAQNRTLSFPTDQAIGTLSTFPPPQQSGDIPGYTKFSYLGNSIGAATGDREVPENAFVGLGVDDVDSNPDLLTRIRTDGIQRLKLNRVTVSTQTLQQIQRIESLRQLTLTECRFVEDIDINSLKGLPRLQELWCSHQKENAGDDGPIVKWASLCLQLQYYYCSSRPSLTTDEIRSFKGHDVPLFLTVTLGDDSVDTIEALSGIPKLVGLNFHVSADGRQDFYCLLPKLNQVVLINANRCGRSRGDRTRS